MKLNKLWILGVMSILVLGLAQVALADSDDDDDDDHEWDLSHDFDDDDYDDHESDDDDHEYTSSRSHDDDDYESDDDDYVRQDTYDEVVYETIEIPVVETVLEEPVLENVTNITNMTNETLDDNLNATLSNETLFDRSALTTYNLGDNKDKLNELSAENTVQEIIIQENNDESQNWFMRILSWLGFI